MTEKMKTLTIKDKNAIFESIIKIKPEKGESLLFTVKTDEYGNPLMEYEVITETAQIIRDAIDEDIPVIFMFDKVALYSVETNEETVKRLEKVIDYVKNAGDGWDPETKDFKTADLREIIEDV